MDIDKIFCSDSKEWLKTLPSESIDSCCADPPAGISMMNSIWDSDKGGRDQWIAWLADIMSEVLRVLKPGGHALIWALPRTSFWTCMALDNAGFEVRDIIHHNQGQGFAKSRAIGKAIDSEAGVKRDIVGTQWTRTQNAIYGGGKGTNTETFETVPATPEAAKWEG